MYGIMPSAKIEARVNDPPKKVLSRSKIPPEFPVSLFGSIPGNTMYEPNLKMTKKPIVLRILTRRSSIEKMFFMVVKKRFIYFTIVTLPPAVSIALVAVAEKA